MINSAPLVPYTRFVPMAAVQFAPLPLVKSVEKGESVRPTSVGQVAGWKVSNMPRARLRGPDLPFTVGLQLVES